MTELLCRGDALFEAVFDDKQPFQPCYCSTRLPEVVNAGKLSSLRGNSYKSWVGDIYSDDQVFEGEKGSFWHIFDGDQVRLVYDICDLLIKVYNIQHIVGHNEIAPGRKIDPGPAFPLDRFRQELLYYDLSEDEPAEFEPVDGEVTADLLNVREFPNTTAKKVTDPLKRGTRVRIMGERSGWYEVEISERGWVSKEYVSTPDLPGQNS